ncbi:MAG TPA: sulfur carrier protein ThiS [Pyrinomonadaceae bacterium]
MRRRPEKKELRVQINGEIRNVADHSTLSDLVDELSLAPARIAVELNGEVVRRNKWTETVLSEGDRLEVVHFVGGG